MLTPCEVITKKFLPAVKASVSKELSEKYHFNQVEIAALLGLTQAAVSKYLSDEYSKPIKKLEKSKEIKKIAEHIAFTIATEKIKKPEIINSVCNMCAVFRKAEEECKYRKLSNEVFEVLKLEELR